MSAAIVTGAAGRVGSEAVKFLSRRGMGVGTPPPVRPKPKEKGRN